MKRKYRILTAAVTLALLGFTGVNLAEAETLKTQDAISQALDSQVSQQTATISNDTVDSDRIIPSITDHPTRRETITTAVWANGTALTAGRTAGQDLTISATYRENYTANRVWSSATASGNNTAEGTLQFNNLNTLNLNVDEPVSSYSEGIASNLYAAPNGTININSSVNTLNANNAVNTTASGFRSNILAATGGHVSIQAPTVNLTRNNYASGIVLDNPGNDVPNRSGRDTFIHIGTDNAPIDTLTIENASMRDAVAGTDRTQDWLYGNSVTDNIGIDLEPSSADTHTREISVLANNINISHSLSALKIQAGGTNGRLYIGNNQNWVQHLNLLDNNVGVHVLTGQADIYARDFNITTRSPANRAGNHETGIVTYGGYGGATINIHTGTGNDEGLSIAGSGKYHDDQSRGILASRAGSAINIQEGNTAISDYVIGIYAHNGGQINFGNNLDGSQGTDNASGDLTISNSFRGISSLNENSGADIPASSVNLHVHDLHLDNNIDTPIIAGGVSSNYRGRMGNVAIRTDGTAYIQSSRPDTYAAISNYGTGSINVNTTGNGDTRLTGYVQNVDSGHIGLSFNSSNSLFDGQAFNVGTGTTDVTVKNGAQWQLRNDVAAQDTAGDTYQSVISNLAVNGGTVDLSHNWDTTWSRSYRTLRTDHLTNGNGSTGTLTFGTDLAASRAANTVNGHSDQLVIGNSASGRYNVMINDHSRSGSPVTNGYVLLVRDLSNGGNQARFLGDTHIQNGGLFLRDVEITDEAPAASDGYTDVPTDGHNWYARLNGPIHSDTPSGPPPLSPNGRHNVSFASGRYANLFLEEDTLRKRIGDLREGKDRGIWVRMYRGEITADGMGGDMTYNTYQIGFDHEIKKTEDSTQYAGISYHHRDMKYNVSGFTHDSEGDADVGSLYWTKLKDDGQYLDVVGRFGRMKGKMDTYGEFPERGRWSSPYQALSVEYGKQFRKENGWYLEPQAQLTYSHLSRGTYTTTQGTHATLSSINSLIGRIGTTFGRKTKSGDYYGMLFWHHEFDGNASYHFLDKNGDTLDGHHDYGGTWLTVGIGGEYRPSDKFTIYADVQKSFGGDVRQKWVWNAGMRWNF